MSFPPGDGRRVRSRTAWTRLSGGNLGGKLLGGGGIHVLGSGGRCGRAPRAVDRRGGFRGRGRRMEGVYFVAGRGVGKTTAVDLLVLRREMRLRAREGESAITIDEDLLLVSVSRIRSRSACLSWLPRHRLARTRSFSGSSLQRIV